MKVWTIQLGQWRIAKKRGIEVIDATVKSGTLILAPSWEIVQGVKAGRITEDAYREAYLEQMRESYRKYPTFWRALLERDDIAIGCYCPADAFCHRYILIGIFEKICQNLDLPFSYEGELTRE